MASTSKKTTPKTPGPALKSAGAKRQRRAKPAPSTKLDQMVAMLKRPNGASLADLTTATGWQAHSVRGAIAGALKKKGHTIGSDKGSGERRYRIDRA